MRFMRCVSLFSCLVKPFLAALTAYVDRNWYDKREVDSVLWPLHGADCAFLIVCLICHCIKAATPAMLTTRYLFLVCFIKILTIKHL
uniref:Secreted protein n=1 Tax=Rhipicephalus appendiculatus TaxID=34631 RepID=A0A131YA77_RHIAP